MIWGKSFGRSVKGYLEVILLHFSFAFYCTVTKNRGVVPAGFLCTFYGILEVRFLPKQFVTTIKKVHRIDPQKHESGIFKKCEFFSVALKPFLYDFLCCKSRKIILLFFGVFHALKTLRTKVIKISSFFGMQHKWWGFCEVQ